MTHHQYGRGYRATIMATISAVLFGVVFWQPAFAKGKVQTVTIEGMAFSPNRLEVASGDTVVWKNKDVVPHNATATDGTFKSPTIAPNRSWKFNVHKAGEFSYMCTLHPIMKATLTVK
jgi:plastocyanin